MADNSTIQDATNKAKSALDKIKVKKEKISEKDNKGEREHATLEKPEELDAALGEARIALDTYAAEVQRNTPVPADVNRLKYIIDKVALVRGSPEHVEAAVKDAKEELDKFAKQNQQNK